MTVKDTVNSTTTKVYTARSHRLGFELLSSVGLTEVTATIIKKTYHQENMIRIIFYHVL